MSYNSRKTEKIQLASININYNRCTNEGYSYYNNTQKLKAASNDPIDNITNNINWTKSPDWTPVNVPK